MLAGRVGIARQWARVGSAGRAGLLIMAVAGLQLVLVIAVLNPRTFFIGDSGVKYLQAYSLVATRWRSLAIPNPAPRIDPDHRFSVLASNQVHRRPGGAHFSGVYSALFTVPVSVCLALLGVRGMYLVAIVASVGTMILTYRLSLRVAPRTAWMTPLVVGACSPMLFYSVDLWEHTLAMLLTNASVLLLVTGLEASSRWRFALAGMTLGAAIAVREELYAMVPAGLVPLTWVAPRQRVPAALAALAGLVGALVPHWTLTYLEAGNPARLSVMRVLRAEMTSGVNVLSAGLDALALVLPPAPWLLPLAAAGAARWWLARADAQRQRRLFLFIAATVVLWATADALRLAQTWGRPFDLASAFPVVLFLFFLPAVSGASAAARRALRMMLAIAVVFAAAVCVAGTFNPQLRHPQWGPRFLLPVCPLLAAGIAFAFEHRGEWVRRLPLPRRLLAAVFAVLVLASLAVQAQGVRELRSAKEQYERLLTAIEAVDRGDVLVTDLWWFAAVSAAVLYDHEAVAVNVRGAGSLPALLQRLDDHGVRALTLVTGAPLADDRARALASAGWSETDRRVVSIWLDVTLVSFRRERVDNPMVARASVPAGGAGRRRSWSGGPLHASSDAGAATDA